MDDKYAYMVKIDIYLSGGMSLIASINTDHMNIVCLECDSFIH